MANSHKKAFLIILDGYGFSKKKKGNAIHAAKKPFIDQLRKKYPTTLLKCSGKSVGLPKGYMGNSEVGHFTIGAGRITFQSLEEINSSIKNKSFFNKKELLDSIQNIKKNNSALHLIGMISDEGVHSHVDHLISLIELAHKHKLKKVYIHCFTDGRDVPERSAKEFIKKIQQTIKKLKTGEIISIIGRYYAMDRDENYNRTEKAYQLLTEQKGIKETDPLQSIENAYQRGDSTDYYIKAISLSDTTIKDKDSIIFFNFRTDRSKQLTQAFVDPTFNKFKKKKLNIHFTCFGPYTNLAPVIFKAPKIKNNLGQILANNNLKQLRIAETEKYAHVTFFFNSQKKEAYKGEDRILVHSPKVPSYAQTPEMSAPKVTEKTISAIKKNKYDFILLNFANPDLVGHSGDIEATKKCIEIIDKCLKKIIPLSLKHNYQIILTADHGNAEEMTYPDGSVSPAHSKNKVECTLISNHNKIKPNNNKGLSDIAPTILTLMDIPKAKEMEGSNIFKLQ